jgi:hypothetical protein
MKKYITLILLTFISLGLFGQDKINVGIEGGGGFRYFRGNSIVDKENSILGYSGGLIFQYNFSKIFSFKTGITYDRKGWGQNVTITNNSGMFLYKTIAKLNYDYLIVPLLVKASFGNKIKYFVNVGPYIGYGVNNNFFISGEGFRPDENGDNKFDQTLKYDLGISSGLGIQYPINDKIRISIEIRNNYGMLNINKRKYSSIYSFYTSSTNLLLGVSYVLK